MSKEVQNEKIEMLNEQDETNIKSQVNEERETDSVLVGKGEGQSDSGFMMEILVCSLILWGFFFLSRFTGYEKIIAKVDSILSTKSNVMMITEMEEEIAGVCQQLLSQQ